MSAREEILARLRAATRPETAPAPWRSRRRFDDLAERFCQALAAAGGEVRRAGDLAEGLAQVGEILAALEVQRAVMQAEPPLIQAELPRRWPEIDWHVVGQTAGDLRAFCAAADIGISSARAALAETGTIVVESGPGRSRLATLLPPVHLALVPASCLVTDIFTWTAGRQAAPPAGVTLISGPSKTADIEQTMAVGVHGPRRFIVVLYDGR